MRLDYSLRRRLIVSMLLVFALGLGGAIVHYDSEVYGLEDDLRERSLQSQARSILADLRFSEAGDITVALPPAWANAYAQRDSTFFYTFYDAARRPIAASPNLAAPLPLIEDRSGSDGVARLRYIGAGPGELLAMAARAPRDHILIVARSDPAGDALADSLIQEGFERLELVEVPFLAVLLLSIWMISGWSLRPIEIASREARLIGPSNTAQRIATKRLPSEIRPLVDAVNGALDRLSRAYAAERQLTADAAHELRTPIAVLDLRLQRAKLDDAMDWPAIELEMTQMNRLVDQLLDLARKESPERAQDAAGAVRINLSRVAREAAAMVLPLADEAGREIVVDAPDDVLIRGDADDLRDMVRNLLDNALDHGRGTVRVKIGRATISGRRRAFVDVEDEGAGVPDALKEEVFDRFRKGRSTAHGCGLGLAIVRQVARNHNGDASFVSGPTCRVRVSLPVESADNA